MAQFRGKRPKQKPKETINYKGYYIELDYLSGNKQYLTSIYKQNLKKSKYAPYYDTVWRYIATSRHDAIAQAKLLINSSKNKSKRTEKFMR